MGFVEPGRDVDAEYACACSNGAEVRVEKLDLQRVAAAFDGQMRALELDTQVTSDDLEEAVACESPPTTS